MCYFWSGDYATFLKDQSFQCLLCSPGANSQEPAIFGRGLFVLVPSRLRVFLKGSLFFGARTRCPRPEAALGVAVGRFGVFGVVGFNIPTAFADEAQVVAIG
ncbi:hypothetical protein IAD21_00656 [Abditibacteriota bacterium]|nr:hypothetical protein IAD21_00656 [Abditibacteriota bacterium]